MHAGHRRDIAPQPAPVAGQQSKGALTDIMSFASRLHFLRVTLTLLLALALASLPVAHRGTAETQQDSAFIAFIQSGGTLADLCDGGSDGHARAALDCEACRIVAGLILPAPAQKLSAPLTATEPPQGIGAVSWVPRNPAGTPPPVRGPPLT